jgi:hypothetical protein
LGGELSGGDCVVEEFELVRGAVAEGGVSLLVAVGDLEDRVGELDRVFSVAG